jgi:hypothetical protein
MRAGLRLTVSFAGLVAAAALGSIAACGAFTAADSGVVEEGGARDGAVSDGGPNDGATAGEGGGSMLYAALVLDGGPLAYWRMGAKTGNVIRDETTHQNALVLERGGFVLGVEGAVAGDTAVRFDGKNAYALATDSSPFEFANGKDFTLECWSLRDAIDGGAPYRHLVTQEQFVSPSLRNSGYALYEIPDKAPRLQFELAVPPDGGGASVGAPAPLDGKWTHYAVVFDGPASKVTLFVNGSIVDSRSVKEQLQTRASTLAVGARGDGVYPFAGVIDEVAIYDRALTKAELVRHVAAATTH